MAVEGAATTAVASVFLASICQAKEGIQQLELLFSDNFRTAVEEDMKQAHQNAEQQWLEEKQDLLRQVEFERQEKLALIHELQKQREKCGIEVQEKNRLQAWIKKKDNELEEKCSSMSRLSNRYIQMKRQYNSIARQATVVSAIKSGSQSFDPPVKKLRQDGKRLDADDGLCNGHVALEDIPHKAQEMPRVFQVETSDVPQKAQEMPGGFQVETLDIPQKIPQAFPVEKKNSPETKMQQVVVQQPMTEPKKKGTLKDFMLANNWRTTRVAEASRAYLDPHDDFLNTPQELALRQKNQVQEPDEDVVPDSLPKDEPDIPEQDRQISIPEKKCQRDVSKQQGPKYKYVEPVRKKADREALQGIDCRQCRRFYDAVEAKDARGVASTRCDKHHEAVSRHRFRYAPPPTPEGFWNIGFDD